MHRICWWAPCLALTVAMAAPAHAQDVGQAPAENNNQAPPSEAAPSTAPQNPSASAQPAPKSVQLHAKAPARNANANIKPALPIAKPAAATTLNIPPGLQTAMERIANALEAANLRQPPADEQSRIKRYYKSQLRIARWTKGLFVVAALDTLLIACGLGFFGLARNAARSTPRHPPGATNVVEQKEENARTGPRPHLFAVDIRLLNPPRPYWLELDDTKLSKRAIEVTYTIENFGDAPAIVREMRPGIYLGAELPPAPVAGVAEAGIHDIVVPVSGNKPAPNFSYRYPGVLTKELLNGLLPRAAPDADGARPPDPTRIFFWLALRYEGPYRSSGEFGALWEYRSEAEKWVPVLDRPDYAYRWLG